MTRTGAWLDQGSAIEEKKTNLEARDRMKLKERRKEKERRRESWTAFRTALLLCLSLPLLSPFPSLPLSSFCLVEARQLLTKFTSCWQLVQEQRKENLGDGERETDRENTSELLLMSFPRHGRSGRLGCVALMLLASAVYTLGAASCACRFEGCGPLRRYGVVGGAALPPGPPRQPSRGTTQGRSKKQRGRAGKGKGREKGERTLVQFNVCMSAYMYVCGACTGEDQNVKTQRARAPRQNTEVGRLQARRCSAAAST